MIIELPVLSGASAMGRYRMGFFHFSNNNLAVRVACARAAGSYDPAMPTSEDVDLCFRITQLPDWAACREPGVIVRHRNRSSVFAMVRQLWGWGINAGRAYRKTGVTGIYLYWFSHKHRTITRDIELPGFPRLVLAFLTYFHVTHLFMLAAALAAIAGNGWVSSALLTTGLTIFWPFLKPLLAPDQGVIKTLKLVAVSYLANITFMSACFIGGLRAGILFVPAPMLPTQGPDGQEAVLKELAS